MELDSVEFVPYALGAVASFVAAYLATRRICPRVLDYWIGIPFQQALVLAYVWYGYGADLITEEQFLFMIGGLAAFALGTRVVPAAPAAAPRPAEADASPDIAALFRSILYSLCVYQALADAVYMIAIGGVPALVPNGIHPNMYAGGFGVVKYIHDANAAALPALAFVLAIFWKDYRALAIGGVCALYPQVLMEWSKASLLGLPLFFVTANYYSAERFGRRLVIPRWVTIVIVPLVAGFVAVKFSEVVAQGYESSIGLAFLKRLMNTADAVFMYFQLDGHKYFEGEVGLLSWLFSHLSGYVGIVDPAAQNFGVLLSQYTLGFGEGGYGSYPPFQVVGHLTMGYWGGLVYAFAIGAALAAIRRWTVGLSMLPAYLVVFNAAIFLSGDSSLFAYALFCHVAVLPAYVVGVALYAGRPGRRGTDGPAPRSDESLETAKT